jgi:hypothetical protein
MSAFLIFGLFVVIVAILIFAYERPKRPKRKISGRGGDFEG